MSGEVMMIKGLTIRNKFILITVFITILLISFSLFLVGLINELATITSDIIDHPLEVSNAASYANVEVLRMHRDLKEILLVDQDYEVNILADKIRVSESKVYIALDTISNYILGEEGKELQAEGRQLFDDWKTIRSEIIEAVRDGRSEDALYISETKDADHIEALERKLLELNQYARKKAVEFQEHSIQLESNTKQLAIGAIVLVLIVLIASIMFMSWNVLGGIGMLSTSLKDIVESGEFKNVTLNGNDELTELSLIFNNLVSSIGHQLWVKKGNQELNVILNTSVDFEKTVSEYIEAFKEYGNFLSVAFYYREDQQLQMMSVANRMIFMSTDYQLGDRFIGECALKNEHNTIHYDGEIAYELPYNTILNYPISYKKQVFGVMCIVLKSTLTDEIMELARECLRDFSVFISTYEQRKRIDDLLEQSMQTNEQLTNRQISLEENQEELEAANSTLQEQRDLLNTKSNELVRQNKELVNLREELVKQYKDLEEVTKYRSQFLTNISHELRTPLNSVIVLSNMLLEKDIQAFDESDKDKIHVITKASNELLLTINDILDLSKVESGKVELNEDVFEPEQLVQEWKTIYEPLIDDKGLTGDFKNMVTKKLYGDKSKISHIVTNFLSNAIKFTEEGGVQVFIDYNDDVDYPVRIDVKDTGIGIEKDKFEDIFHEFVQTDGSISRLYGGTGLGLAICKNYAQLINGQTCVESVLGEGSMFSLLLPSACLLDEYTLIQKEEKQVYQQSKQRLLDQHLNKKVLICDDEPMNVFALSTVLEDIGVFPIAAFSGDDVLESYKNDPDIDMILMDYMMPENNGFSVIRKLKKLKEWHDVPVAIITAASLEAKELEVINNERYILVRKPIVYNKIVELLNDHL